MILKLAPQPNQLFIGNGIGVSTSGNQSVEQLTFEPAAIGAKAKLVKISL